MTIVDAQLHPVVPVHSETIAELAQPAVVCELTREAMDCVGVDVALLTGGVEICTSAVNYYPQRFVGVVTYFDASGDRAAPDRDIESLFAAYLQTPGIGAVRTGIVDWSDGSLARGYRTGALDRVFATAERLGAPLFLFASGQPGAVARIANAYPQLQIIVDHLGLPQTPMPVADDPWSLLPTTNSLARFDNVAIKFCGAPTLSRAPYPHADIWPQLATVLEAFGPERIMWGSDMTRLRMKPGTNEIGDRRTWSSTYAEALGYVRDTDRLSNSEKQAILGGTARRLLDIPAPAQ
ncbi:amidohydrolase family protein [uncultured Jatrophihabitans sp.]|uniref:amidohydrolase family protein n=1 Tax=uncultured Jatrophihabitans sp. TaxID=1610747 RepID=UPI0035CC0B28